MPTLLHLGPANEPPVSLGDDCLIPHGPVRVEETDAADLIADALASPVGFPPLSQAIVPGDHIALAFGEGIPDLLSTAAGLVEAILQTGAEPEHVSLVTLSESDASLLQDGVGMVLPVGTNVERHDPKNKESLCFAGMTRKDDETLLINRVLFDADLAIPVSCVRAASDPESRGAYGGLYPAFSDAECQKQYRKSAVKKHKRWLARTEEAGWLIGAPFVVRVVPGPHDTVAAVVAGAPREAVEQSDEVAAQFWRRTADEGASLVIATISGGADRQTWDDVARALVAADQVAAVGGAVALCTELEQPVGRSLAKLCTEGDMEAAEAKLRKDAHPDTWAAREIARALQRGPVFMRSRLRPSVVEDLGMAPITSATELQRLADRFGTVALLEDAPHLEFMGSEE